jgi:hypothetical protein
MSNNPHLFPSLHGLSLISGAKSRSISAENPTGAKGGGAQESPEGNHPARELGKGWKVKPCVTIPPGETVTLAQIEGAGTIRHIWMTGKQEFWRRLIVRFYWDDEPKPSIEVPFGDFFANGWSRYAPVNSIPIAVNARGGFNSYWEMPFRKSAKITIENLWHEPHTGLFYQIDYELGEVPENAAYLHAQWRRANPTVYKEPVTLLDGVAGHGHYVGTYLAWQSNSNHWWGEGEIKFYIDGDSEYPTICGTGTEDYFGGAWCFEVDSKYETYSTPYLGFHQVIKPDGAFESNTRFGMYRWHIPDPIRFENDLKVTLQALGWRSNYRFLPLQDDISSTVLWFQTEPHAPFPLIGDVDALEVV